MRLTSILFKYRREFHGHIPTWRGRIDIGKDRYVPAIGKSQKYQFWRQTLAQMETIKYLSVPYINQEQETAYLQSIGRTQPEYQDDYMNKKIVHPLKQRYAADFLELMDVSRKFEEED